MREKKLKITQSLANGYSFNSTRQELSYEYQHDSVLHGFQNVCVIVPLAKVASASQGFIKVDVHVRHMPYNHE